MELGKARVLREGMEERRTETEPTPAAKLIEGHEWSACLVKRDEEQEDEEQRASIALAERDREGGRGGRGRWRLGVWEFEVIVWGWMLDRIIWDCGTGYGRVPPPIRFFLSSGSLSTSPVWSQLNPTTALPRWLYFVTFCGTNPLRIRTIRILQTTLPSLTSPSSSRSNSHYIFLDFQPYAFSSSSFFFLNSSIIAEEEGNDVEEKEKMWESWRGRVILRFRWFRSRDDHVLFWKLEPTPGLVLRKPNLDPFFSLSSNFESNFMHNCGHVAIVMRIKLR